MTKRTKTSGTSACVCSVCRAEHPSTIKGKRHRRCPGIEGAPARAKHSGKASKRGEWVSP